MTKQTKTPRPLAGGSYVRDANGLRQVDATTAPHPGKSAAAARQAPAPAPTPSASPKADKPTASDK